MSVPNTSVSNSPGSLNLEAGQDLSRSLLIWRACLTIPHTLAILSAIYRLYRRTKTRQVWLDDYIAAFTLLLDCVYFPSLWLGAASHREVVVVATWIARIVLPLLIWFTRVSFALSIARAIPPNQRMRIASICFACLFAFIGLGLAVEGITTCAPNSGDWDHTYPYQCPMSLASAIFRTSMGFFADIALIVIPFCAFWRRLKLPRVTRRLIKACFAASLLTFISCVVTAIILFGRSNAHSAEKRAETGFLALVMSHLMASTSLLVCNMLVVVTSVYRFFRAEDPVAAIGNPQQPLASITDQTSDLESSHTSSNGATTTTTDATRSRVSTSMTVTSRIELTELFDSNFSHSVSEGMAYVQYNSSEKSGSPDNTVDSNKFGCLVCRTCSLKSFCEHKELFEMA